MVSWSRRRLFYSALNQGAWASIHLEGSDLSAFLSDQLDFIFFFYGMAFILLAATCWAAARGQDDSDAWTVLGAFAFVHGMVEWLDLTALIVGDAPAFALGRMALVTLSFMLLME